MMLYTRNAKFILLITLIHLFAPSAVFAVDPAPPVAPLWGFETPAIPASNTQVKWHPGHYLLGGPERTNFSSIANKPLFQGAQVSYNWRDLEPTKGKYDFSAIDKSLNALKAINKRLVIKVRFKTFNTQAAIKGCAPEYIFSVGGAYLFTGGNGVKKCVTAQWKQPAIDAINRLITALGARYNDDPSVEALVFEETALGLDGEPNQTKFGYTLRAYLAGLKSNMLNAKKAFPNTVVLQQANYLSDKQTAMDELIEYAYSIGVGFSGPDLMPKQTTEATLRFPDYAGMMPLGIDNQRADIKGVSPSAAFKYAIDDPNGLRSNYIFWTLSKPSPWNFEQDIAPLIVKNKGRRNANCPSNISCAAN